MTSTESTPRSTFISPGRYFLSTSVFACVTEGYAVFLDLKRDEYIAIEPARSHNLQYLVCGWPASGATSLPSALHTNESRELIATLLKTGLITENASRGKPATPVDLKAATSTFWTDNCPWPQLARHHLVNFTFAWITITALLQAAPLHSIVARLRRRKSHQTTSGTDNTLSELHRLTMNYFALQPAYFSDHNACLRNSLTLVEFLSRYDLYPTLAIGVTASPFSAHAWVQHESVVLTDSLDEIRKLTPILTI